MNNVNVVFVCESDYKALLALRPGDYTTWSITPDVQFIVSINFNLQDSEVDVIDIDIDSAQFEHVRYVLDVTHHNRGLAPVFLTND